MKNATQLLITFQTTLEEFQRAKELGATGQTWEVASTLPVLSDLVDFLKQAEGLELLSLIRGHDWYYMMSDDPKACWRGELASRVLRDRFKNAVDQERAKTIWARHAGDKKFPGRGS